MEQDIIARIVSQLEESAAVKKRIVETCLDELVRAAEMLLATYRQGHKVLLCGNGGSAADAQHLAGGLDVAHEGGLDEMKSASLRGLKLQRR